MITTSLGTVIGTIVTPEFAGRIMSAVYPAIGGFIGALAGFSFIFIINLILTPYRQRNETHKRVLELESKSEDKSQQAQLRSNISTLIIEGTSVLNGFKSIHTFTHIWPIEDFKAWREHVFEILTRHQLNDDCSLFYRDIGIDMSTSLLDDYIRACEAGLDRLEEILAMLRG